MTNERSEPGVPLFSESNSKEDFLSPLNTKSSLFVPSTLVGPRARGSFIIENDHASDSLKHGFEVKNPHPELVTKVNGLPIVCVKSFDPDKPSGELNSFLATGRVEKDNQVVHASLPYEYVLAAAQVTRELCGANSMFTSRVTLWQQDTLETSGKPPATKLKTGKGGISGGVIPVDLETTTNEGPGGALVALKQNPNHRPSPLEEKITTVQWAKPLEQIILGLDKVPPDFILDAACTKEKIAEQGYIEFKMNCSDSAAISNTVYRVDLCQSEREGYAKETVKPIKIKETGAKQPDWWNETKFGEFNIKSHEAYHVEYKKSSGAAFEAYMVYAEINEKGKPLPITGDQDGFFKDRPPAELYDLKELGTEVVNTHNLGGGALLADKLKEVHNKILLEDYAAGRVSEDDLSVLQDNFQAFLAKSQTYIEDMGIVTPFEAYFLIQLNNRIAQIKEEYRDNPEGLKEQVSKVDIELHYGMKNLPIADFDIHTAWFKELPEEFSERVTQNMARGFHVSPQIQEMQMDYLQSKNELSVMPHEDSQFFDSVREQAQTLASDNPDWKVYAKVEGDPPPCLPGGTPEPGPHYTYVELNGKHEVGADDIKELIITTPDLGGDGKGKNIIRVKEDGVTSSLSGDRGQDHLNEFQAKVDPHSQMSLSR